MNINVPDSMASRIPNDEIGVGCSCGKFCFVMKVWYFCTLIKECCLCPRCGRSFEVNMYYYLPGWVD